MHPGSDRSAERRARLRRLACRESIRRGIVRHAAGAIMAGGALIAGGQSGAGHSVGHFPSYYPDEIRIEAVDPVAAAKGLSDHTLHAYVNATPAFAGSVPAHVKAVTSLGSFLVLSFDAASPRFATADARCSAARGILAALKAKTIAGFVVHPYAITPYHADYLHHLDRIEEATSALGRESVPALKPAARGRLAETIVQAGWDRADASADVVLEAMPADALIVSAGARFDGWSGLPWAKEGWFQAYQLLAPGLDAAARQAADEIHEQLISDEGAGMPERLNLQRHLVTMLTRDCNRVIAGYAPKEEYVDEAYPEGIENVAYDSLNGLSAPVFFRTVKLKEYPWNGKLHLGVRDRAAAAWNPVAGFTDATGRLVWSAVGDPAMIQFPFNASWMPNRVQATLTRVEGRSGGIRVPADAIRPRPGSGALKPVGARTFSSMKLVYEVLASPFEDGTDMGVADLLYPYAFAYRWGSKIGASDNAHEPRLQPVFAAMQDRLVGVKAVRVERTPHAVAEGMEIVRKTPVLEVYLRNAPGDERQISSLAPPWSAVPWHLLALMEEAVTRGYAAFSEEESKRRNVPWLDLVRDPALRAKLQELVAQFERERFRPATLRDLVTADEAQARWRSLRLFAEANGHFLVANGPYRLKEWSADAVVLQAVREVTYPLGFGTFDRFVNPPRAVLEDVAQSAGTITVRANAEMVLKMGREYKLANEPLLRTTMRGTVGLLVVSRYLLIDAGGKVLNVDKMTWREDGRFTVNLPKRLPPGQYTVILAVLLDGNSMLPSAKLLRLRVGGTGPPG